jgi:hypothetical protein
VSYGSGLVFAGGNIFTLTPEMLIHAVTRPPFA